MNLSHPLSYFLHLYLAIPDFPSSFFLFSPPVFDRPCLPALLLIFSFHFRPSFVSPLHSSLSPLLFSSCSLSGLSWRFLNPPPFPSAHSHSVSGPPTSLMSHSLILPVFNSPRLPSLSAVSVCCRLSARHFVGFINSASPSSRVITLHDSPFPFPAVSLSLSPGSDASPVSQTVGGTAASQSKYFVIVVVFWGFFANCKDLVITCHTDGFFFPKQKKKNASRKLIAAQLK